MLDTIETALSSDSLSYGGEYYQIGDVQLEVKPINARPRTYLAGVTSHPTLPRRAAENFHYIARAARALRLDYVELDGTTIKDLPFDGELSFDEIINNRIIGGAESIVEKIVDEMQRASLSHYACLVGVGDMEPAKVLRSLE